MNRELIEAAKAVIADRDRLGAMFEWEGNDVLPSPNTLRWQAFVAAVRAAEAATNCGGDGYFTQRENTDAEKNAAIQYADGLVSLSGDEGAFHGTRKNVHEAVRLAFLAGARSRDEAAPVADTVAVPVAAIRRLKSTVSSFGVGIPDWARRAREAADEITKLLPPPPAPEPSEELVAEWEREAAEYAKATHTEGGFIRPVIRGYVAARRAEWAKKGGG